MFACFYQYKTHKLNSIFVPVMTKITCWLCCILGFVSSSHAQEVQWASKLLGFSSEYIKETTGKEYRAVQALGYPNTITPFGETACAWSPYNADSNVEEWIKVAFERPQKARQVLMVALRGSLLTMRLVKSFQY